jgi:hypothetical protein
MYPVPRNDQARCHCFAIAATMGEGRDGFFLAVCAENLQVPAEDYTALHPSKYNQMIDAT